MALPSATEAENWVLISFATNGSKTFQKELPLEWDSIDSNSEVVAMSTKGGNLAGFRVLGRLFDLKKWIRQIGISEQVFRNFLSLQEVFR